MQLVFTLAIWLRFENVLQYYNLKTGEKENKQEDIEICKRLVILFIKFFIVFLDPLIYLEG